MSRLSNVEFRELNGEAPLFPGKANYISVMVREPALRANLKDEDLALDAGRKWWSRNMPGVAPKEFRVLGAYAEPPRGKTDARVQPDYKPDVQKFGYVWLALTWDHLADGKQAIAWPWDTGDIEFLNDWEEPYGGLWQVFQPGASVHVPGPVENVLWALGATGDQIADDAAEAGEKAKDALGSLLVPLAVAFGGVAAFLLLGRRK
jgi:hypothetical protein